MALKKVTFIKDWTHPVGTVNLEGDTARVTPDLYAELLEGGYIAAPKTKRKTTTKNKK